jgi:hypothetical protein
MRGRPAYSDVNLQLVTRRSTSVPILNGIRLTSCEHPPATCQKLTTHSTTYEEAGPPPLWLESLQRRYA